MMYLGDDFSRDEALNGLYAPDQTEILEFSFVRESLDNLRKDFQKQFNCQQSDADYYIFNSIKWE